MAILLAVRDGPHGVFFSIVIGYIGKTIPNIFVGIRDAQGIDGGTL